MNEREYFILLDAIVTSVSALFSLAYYLKWRNGKTWVRIATFLLMGYFATIYILVLFNVISEVSFGFEYLRPVTPALYVLSCADVIVDWRKNSANLTEKLRRELPGGISAYIETKTRPPLRKK